MTAALQSRRIDTGRITLHVREAGKGPLVIYLHGITSNSAVWDPFLLAFQLGAYGVAVDQRGHGLSDKPVSGYGADDYAKDVLALIDALGRGPAIIVGHSLGARNGITAAALRPDLVRHVIAIDFTPFIETEVFDSLEARVNGGDRLFASRAEIEAYLKDRYRLMPDEAIRIRALSAYAEAEGGFRPLASPAAMAATAAGLREDLAPALAAVKVPTLLVRGAQSLLVSPAAFERTKALRPDLPTLLVEGADHYVNEEKPEPIMTAVREALGRYPAA